MNTPTTLVLVNELDVGDTLVRDAKHGGPVVRGVTAVTKVGDYYRVDLVDGEHDYYHPWSRVRILDLSLTKGPAK